MKKILNHGLKPVHFYGINLLPFPSNAKPRDKTILDIFRKIESRINESPMMHLFNEVLVVLKKYSLALQLLNSIIFHEIIHFFYGCPCLPYLS